MTSFETFDPGVVRCGNTVLQSGTQSHTGVIFPLVRISSTRKNMSIFIISKQKGMWPLFCLTAHCFKFPTQFAATQKEDQLSPKHFWSIHVFSSQYATWLCRTEPKTPGSPISCESAASNGVSMSTPSSISSKPSVTQAHRRLLIVCLPIIYQPPPPAFACLVSFYCPSV